MLNYFRVLIIEFGEEIGYLLSLTWQREARLERNRSRSLFSWTYWYMIDCNILGLNAQLYVSHRYFVFLHLYVALLSSFLLK